MSDLKQKILINIHKGLQSNTLSNEDLVQIIEHVGLYLNLMTISDYAKSKKLSYNGVKRFRTIRILFGSKFVIDNI